MLIVAGPSQLRHHCSVTFVSRFAASTTYKAYPFAGNACDPQNFEPNLALNLEIVDVINAKKAGA